MLIWSNIYMYTIMIITVSQPIQSESILQESLTDCISHLKEV